MTYSRHPKSPPTDGQVRYLKILAKETATTYFMPTSFGTADAQIKELRKLPKVTATDRRRERDEWGSLAEESGDAAAIREDELAGYGSTATWAAIVASSSTRPAPGPERIHSMGPDRRRDAYEEGGLRRDELTAWAVHYPDEVPLINGELPWIAANLD